MRNSRDIGAVIWDNKGTHKNGPSVIGAETPLLGPNPHKGGAMRNHTRPNPEPRADAGDA